MFDNLLDEYIKKDSEQNFEKKEKNTKLDKNKAQKKEKKNNCC